MEGTSYYFSAISWREPVTIFQLYHGGNQLQFSSYIMKGTSYIFQLYHGGNQLHFSAISWREPVTYQYDADHDVVHFALV
jgi:hypothetical protein